MPSDQRHRPEDRCRPDSPCPSTRALLDRLAAAEAEREALQEQLHRAHTGLDSLRADLRAARLESLRAAQAEAEHGMAVFPDREEQFRFDVHTAWARRIPASEKRERPLPRYLLGPNFLDTVDQLHGVRRDKVIAVAVEILTGLAHELPGREVHQLREFRAGNSATVVRADGAIAWRVSLQVRSPSARRLHYWQAPNGTIEFARVCVHDDVRM